MLPFLSEAQLILNIGKWPSVLRRSFRFRRFRVPHTKPFCLWMHPCFHIRLRFAASVRAALPVLISSYAFPPGSNLALFLFYQKGSLFVRHEQCYAYSAPDTFPSEGKAFGVVGYKEIPVPAGADTGMGYGLLSHGWLY